MNYLNEPYFNKKCETATPFEMLLTLTNGNIRGLDTLVLNTLLSKKRLLPPIVVNALLVYFFNSFAEKVYDRNDLSRLHDYWLAKRVCTFSQAREMFKEDINQVLQRLKNN
ncbi:hypothetical protein RCG23_00485 [Neobacillus sp. PS3-34]|uniref:hypothetical protein n=1 Tax=Neobacillus sp. PS3-34 TaxID=3070678 RepID=UPI0027DF4A33|nr:hypothetical protein [Neobacillus sp. PS3-34]WML48667.1 hypothetical protein RCG23_00485 [Neobacillus sp. PS3-34]